LDEQLFHFAAVVELARAYLDFDREAAATFVENEYGYTPTQNDA
jgi:hypothetical protein